MPGSRTVGFERALAVLAGLAIVAWLAVLPGRLLHPFELEWQEGGMLAHVARVLDGEPLYAPPDLEFMAFPYPPLYTWAAAGVAAILGEGFLALRLVSALATIVTLVLVARYVARDTGRPLAGLVAAGVFAAAFRYAGAWFDVGRVDSLALALVVGALYVARFRSGVRAGALAGVLAGVAFLVKQTALGMVVPIVVPLLLRNRRDALGLVLGAVAVAGGGALALHLVSDGWSSFYLFELLRGHPTFAPKVWGFWSEDAVILAPTFFAALAGLPRTADRQGRAFLGWAAAGMVATAWIGRAHQGGYDNTLLPAALACALLAGRAFGSAIRRGGAVGRGVCVLLLLQLALLAYDPREQVPSRADVETGNRIVAELAAIDGPVFAPHQGYLAERAGKGPSVHAMTVIDLLSSSGNEDVAQGFVDELEGALAEQRFAAILLANPWEDLIALHTNYGLAQRMLAEGELVPVTGAPERPELLYLPRGE